MFKKQIVKAAAVVLAFATTPTWASAPPCKVLVMGDSLSAAYGLSPEQGWVRLMEASMAEKFPHCRVVNASVSGETTAGGKTRLAALLKTHQPTHMVLELGANDGLRGLPIEVMKNNLTDMVKLAKTQGVSTVLVGMQIPPNYGPQYTQRFSQAFQDVSKAQGLPLVPFMLDGFADQAQAFQADGIHPNAASQPRILNNIWPVLRKQLPQR